MTGKRVERYRRRLQEMLDRIRRTAKALEDEVRVPTGGEASGSLSNAPMHMGDVGTDVYTQELSATLLDTEARLRDEVLAALRRIARGTYGTCEVCGKAIPLERLDVLPYTRFCVQDAQANAPLMAANFNEGRAKDWPEDYDPRADGSEADWPDRGNEP